MNFYASFRNESVNMEQYISESIQKIDAQKGKENAARYRRLFVNEMARNKERF